MEVVCLFNGLGNQMSQYAFYLAKKNRNPFRTVWIYFPDPRSNTSQHNGYELDRVFGIKRNKFREKFLVFIYNLSIARKILNWRIEAENYDFDPEMLIAHSYHHIRYFRGGWHSEKYFKNVQNQILNTFKFREDRLNKNSEFWYSCIRNFENSCSIHVRRGDYLANSIWQGVATLGFYKRAIKMMKTKFPDIHFFVFSNDLKWCKDNFEDDNIYYVESNDNEDSWQDMFLMSRCRHHINANSTFSWWGAWLTPFKDSIVVVPSQFRSDMMTKDVYPEKWIKL